MTISGFHVSKTEYYEVLFFTLKSNDLVKCENQHSVSNLEAVSIFKVYGSATFTSASL